MDPRVRTSEKSHATANHRRCPNFSSGENLPQLCSVMPIDCIHFAVVASEQNLICEHRRSGMNLTASLEFPLCSACDDIDGMQCTGHRGDIQVAVFENRCRTH